MKNYLKPLNNESGMVLLLAMLIMSALILLGTTAVMESQTDLRIAGNYKTSAMALYAAEAGIEEARARLKGDFTPSGSMIVDSSPTNPAWTSSLSSLQSTLTYTVNIQHKTSGGSVLYWGDSNGDGTNEQNTTTGQNIYLVTSTASSASASKTLEAAMTRIPPVQVAGALYGNMIGGGGNVSVNGTDNCGASGSLPALAYVTSQTLWPSGSVNCLPAGNEVAQVPAIDLAQQVTALQAVATDILTSDQTNYTVGSPTDYRTVYCDATVLPTNQQLDLQNVTGYGTLVVRGDVYFSGNLNWRGVIIALGNVSFYGGGSNAKNILGAVLSLSTATVQGTVNISYDSCEVRKTVESMPLLILSWKDIAGS